MPDTIAGPTGADLDPSRASGAAPAQPVVISVCTSCRVTDGDGFTLPGEMLLAALQSVEGDAVIQVRPVQCLSVCKRPCTVALSAPGRYTYVFGDLDPAVDAAALVACARSYAAQDHGYLLWRERPEPLRRGIVARIPPVGWTTEDGRHPR